MSRPSSVSRRLRLRGVSPREETVEKAEVKKTFGVDGMERLGNGLVAPPRPRNESLHEYVRRVAPEFELILRAEHIRLLRAVGEHAVPNVKGTPVDRLIVLGHHAGTRLSEFASLHDVVCLASASSFDPSVSRLPDPDFLRPTPATQTRHEYHKMSFSGPNGEDWGCVFYGEGHTHGEVIRATWRCFSAWGVQQG